MSTTNNQFFLNLTSFLIYLYPISLIFSPFLTNSIIFFIGIYGLINIKSFDLRSLIKNQFIIYFLIFWILISFRSIFTEHIFFSLKSSFLFIKYLLFTLGFFFVIKNNKNFMKNFTKVFLFVFLIISFDAFIQFFYGTNLIGYSANQIENERISGLFGDELILGSYVARFSFLIIALILYTNLKIKNIYIFLFIILSFSTTLISGERTALALSIMSIIFFIILTNLINIKLKISLFIILSLIITGSYKFNDKIKHRMNMTVRDVASSEHILMFSEGHGSHFKTAFNLFKANKIFGQGANNFRKKCSNEKFFVGPYGCSTHPHNMYLQLLAETGVLGFIFLFLIFLKIVIYSLKHFYIKYFKRQNYLLEYEIALLTCMLINFWPIVPTGNFFSSSFGNISIIPIIILFLSDKFNKLSFKH